VDELWNYAWEMMERRIKGAGREVRPGTEVEVEVAPKRRKGKRKRKKASQNDIPPLTKWLTREGG